MHGNRDDLQLTRCDFVEYPSLKQDRKEGRVGERRAWVSSFSIPSSIPLAISSNESGRYRAVIPCHTTLAKQTQLSDACGESHRENLSIGMAIPLSLTHGQRAAASPEDKTPPRDVEDREPSPNGVPVQAEPLVVPFLPCSNPHHTTP